MITYSIEPHTGVKREVKITYSKEGKQDFSSYALFSSTNPSESEIEEVVKEHSYAASHFWEHQESSIDEVVLPNNSGSVKEAVFEAMPQYNSATQKLEPTTVESETTITHTYDVVDLTPTEKGLNIKQKRIALLQATDVYALSDRTLPTAMQNYRQALRDITEQETFPNSVVWPTLPVD